LFVAMAGLVMARVVDPVKAGGGDYYGDGGVSHRFSPRLSCFIPF
jgi:hypothetical protein